MKLEVKLIAVEQHNMEKSQEVLAGVLNDGWALIATSPMAQASLFMFRRMALDDEEKARQDAGEVVMVPKK